MILREIIKDIDCKVLGSADTKITGIEYDSRKVTKGCLFIAVKGYKTDGHEYIKEAIDNGAVAVMAEHIDSEISVVKIITQNTRIGLAIASKHFYGDSVDRLKIIGITGTNGKTTTTYLIKQILDLMGYKTGLMGTNQNVIVNEAYPAERTTAESAELHRTFKLMEEKGVEYVIMEVSSHSLYLNRTYGINFEVGIFSNMTQDHLDFHKTMENYAKSKSILFSQSKCSVINSDDKWHEFMEKESKGKIVTYGIEKEAMLKAYDIRLSEKGVIFKAQYNDENEDIRLGIPGKISVYNSLAAAAACLALGASMEDVKRGLMVARGVKGRLEVVHVNTPYTVIIDYAHTPDGIENVIRAVRSFSSARIITLFGCGGDRDKTKRPVMGRIAAELSDFCVVTSDNPRSEEPSDIINDIVGGMKGYEEKYTIVENRAEAIGYAMSIANKDDIIILAGKGHETYQILKDKTIDFDERVYVKKFANG